jgi:hypothetical protein
MKQNQPKNWPGRYTYSSESVGVDINIGLLRLLLFSPYPEDQAKITPCIEEKRVHPHLEIRTITPSLSYKGPKPHPLAHLQMPDGQPHRGLFAREKIPKGTALGEFVGEISLFSYDSLEGKSGTYTWIAKWKNQYLICIDSRKMANEMMYINDYRGLQEAPNTHLQWLVNRGLCYFGCTTTRDIEPDEEIALFYGSDVSSFS